MTCNSVIVNFNFKAIVCKSSLEKKGFGRFYNII